ncbi:class I SAM-dependent RNA methyltransferase [Sphingomicrobium flavum]|uniref:class I SAM-dependent RNA methyltransferase n=1 Tax=Sphingomicrobium flavum TaxID=1229164 RepID=UPI0021AD82D0|nr:class I SAM-dependent RNA methyltransferase [Sphingomicrobium flavum]
MSEEIIRIAARGDGVTASGKFVALTAPGDTVDGKTIVERGPHYQIPPCHHFPTCGGCQLQHLDAETYAGFVTGRIEDALAHHGLSADIAAPHLSLPRSRRRASLKAMKAGGKVIIGFNEGKSHRIVDTAECHILRPELFDMLQPLRHLLATMLPQKRSAGVQMTLVDQGVDLLISGVKADGLEAAEALSAFAEAHPIARLALDEGYGPEPRYEPRPVTISLSGTPVGFPIGSFLQATDDGEGALIAAAKQAIQDHDGPTLDLFAGLGTFALAVASETRPVIAAEAARDAILSLKMTANRAQLPIEAEHRDLYRRPYEVKELAAIKAVILDPPRSGAEAQVAELAQSDVPVIAYVSCNPATFARDAEMLVKGGYRLDWVKPVGQFLWSTHVELAARFSR